MIRLPKRLGHRQPAELVQHLDELRARLVVCAVALVATTAVAFAVHGRLLSLLTSALPAERRQLVTLGVTEPFMTSLKISLVAGFGLALPVVLWQLWGFLAPVWERRTQRVVAVFAAAGGVLFFVGCLVGQRLALPAAVGFLTSYDADQYDILVRARDYLSFAVAVVAAVGVVFELPLVVLGLVRIGITSSAALRRKRRIGYVAMAALAVALPGVDPVTTAIEMIPLMALYEASIWVAAIFERRWRTAPLGAAGSA